MRGEAPLAARLTKSGTTHTSIAPVLSFPAQAARLARRLSQARVASGRTAYVPPSFLGWLETRGNAYREALLAAPGGRLELRGDVSLELDGLDLA